MSAIDSRDAAATEKDILDGSIPDAAPEDVPTLKDISNAPPKANSDHDSDVLSDLDEAFEDFVPPTAVREDKIELDETTVTLLGKHKKKPGSSREPTGPVKGQKHRRKRRRSFDEDEQIKEKGLERQREESPGTKARRELNEKMDAALKPNKKRRKKKDEDDTRYDEMVDSLRRRMIEAADEDYDLVGAQKPAMRKLALLQEVQQQMSIREMQQVALDGDMLTAIRRWLEPLPGKSLPAYSIQKAMFDLLQKLRPDSNSLRESGIGKIVMFYTKDIRPQQNIKREADRLVKEWARPLLGKSDDYRNRTFPTEVARSRHDRYDRDADDYINPLAPKLKSNRAIAPQAVTKSYLVAPQSRVTVAGAKLSRPKGYAEQGIVNKIIGKKTRQ